VDARYVAMMNAIEHDQTPNFFVLHYDRSRWEVRDLILIPRFVLSPSCIEKRRPLGPEARPPLLLKPLSRKTLLQSTEKFNYFYS
jgi:hypothetical protein